METNQQDFGVQELYRPGDGNAEMWKRSIVAVHGLNGNATMTWTSENICWLKHPDFLPKYIPNARVLVWGYNANVSSIAGPTSSDGILQHAHSLVHQLEADRDPEDATTRLMIFLCHSLGGIIVKRALAYSASRKSSKLAHIQLIYTSTYAILFFGTPHTGSRKAELLGNLQNLVHLAMPKKVINFEDNLSEILQNINDQFAPLMAEFRIYFFWEQHKTDLKYTKDYIVEESSAAPTLDNTERCGNAADHSEMCKFNSNSSQGFRTAIAALRRYARDAPKVIRIRHERAKKALQENQVYQAADGLRGTELEHSWLSSSNRTDAPLLREDSHVLQLDNEPAHHIGDIV
ncbi:LipA and NB-ARC [Aspergillus sclerotialis]|uniref:LipA and NB-ARC n=1 Tax=Aspergillus sclerotialis TaxID=2070753 RepID=A0A3A2ZS79_9EURO|nr:LipA and NB-ARC [Aspergillus sclerotialis]